jgi:hypothetical protein
MYRAAVALAEVRRTTERIFPVDVPLFKGRSEARALISSGVTQAAQDARNAVVILNDAGFEPSLIAPFSEQAAVFDHLANHLPFRTQSIHNRLRPMQDVVNDAEASRKTELDAAAFEHAHKLLDTPPAEFTEAHWKDLLKLARINSIRRAYPSLTPLYFWTLDDVSRGRALHALAPAHVKRLLETNPARIRQLATELLAKDPKTLTEDERHMLRAIIENDKEGTFVPGPRLINGVGSFASLLQDEYGPAQSRFFGAAKMGLREPEEIESIAQRLLKQDFDEYRDADWIALRGILDIDTDRKYIPQLGAVSTSDFQHFITQHLNHTTQDQLHTYFNAMKFSVLPSEQKRAAVVGVLEKSFGDLTSKDNSTLFSALVTESVPTDLGGPSAAIRTYIYEPSKLNFNAARLALSDPAELREEGRRILALGADEVSLEQWGRLHSILTADPHGEIIVHPKWSNSWPFESHIKWKLAGDKYFPIEPPFYEARKINTPEYEALRGEAFQRMLRDEAAPDDLDIIGTAMHKMIQRTIRNAPPKQRLLATSTFLRTATTDTNSKIRDTTLESLHNVLSKDGTVIPAMNDLRDETLALIDRNLARHAHRRLAGDIDGFSGYEDFADIGQIKTNIDFMAMIS